MASVSFYLNTGKYDKKGRAPIYVQFDHNKKRFRLYTGEKIDPFFWSKSKASYIKPSYNDDILITLHRRENHEELPAWFEELNALAEKYPKYNFIMPAHPNPAVQEHLHLLTKVQVIDPVPHDEFMNMLAECRLIISDSGGIQEEASFLRKKVIVCRESTERQEGCGTGHLIMCKTPYRLKEVFRTTILNYIGGVSCPFGDGLSGKRVARILCK